MSLWLVAGIAWALTLALIMIVRDKTDLAVMAVVFAFMGLVALWWFQHPY